jgi:mRNA interferase MazF
MVKRYDVHLVPLDPAQGSEYQKTRPCVIVSPDEMNDHLNTVIIAPMTTVRRAYKMRAKIIFQEKEGDVALDQVRAVDKKRLGRRLGALNESEAKSVSRILVEMFS